MLTKEILDSHPLKTLKKKIAKQNIKGYSNMKRPELTDLMMKHKDKFMDLKHAEKKEKKAPKAKAPKAKASNKKPLTVTTADGKVTELKKKAPKAKAPSKTEGTHTMPDGSKMTGKVHSKDSKPVKKEKPKPKAEKKTPIKKTSEKPKPKTKAKKPVHVLQLAPLKDQGVTIRLGSVLGPDGKIYSQVDAKKLWRKEGFTVKDISKQDKEKINEIMKKIGFANLYQPPDYKPFNPQPADLKWNVKIGEPKK